jgi:hypothetical protein
MATRMRWQSPSRQALQDRTFPAEIRVKGKGLSDDRNGHYFPTRLVITEQRRSDGISIEVGVEVVRSIWRRLMWGHCQGMKED